MVAGDGSTASGIVPDPVMTAQFPGTSLVRLALWLLVTLAAIPVQLCCLALGPGPARAFPPHYHRVVLRVLGIRVTATGRPPAQGPVLIAANHMSYLDPDLLASLMPATFVAKADVAKWPFFGMLAKLQRSVFIERSRKQAAGGQRDVLAERLRQGEILVLFPEGTSSDGNRVLPFKSALFGAAETAIDGAPVPVQPVSIAYVRLNGMPLGRTLRPYVAWYGDMSLLDHLWIFAGLGRIDAVVEYHEPVTIDAFGSRKALAAHCRQVVARGVETANTGRAPQASPPAALVAPAPTGIAVPA